MGLESSLKRTCEKWVKKHYPHAVVRKRHGTSHSTLGDPDLSILVAGLHCEIELKQPGQQPTPIQLARLREWAAAGAHVACVHSTQELADFFAQLPPPPVRVMTAGASLPLPADPAGDLPMV